jgi:DNA-3-methyladenine glycosylase
MEPLDRKFYQQNTLTVARSLIGKTLVFEQPQGRLAGIILETEAYRGPRDKASHARRGLTPRTKLMFGPPGFAYIYLIYGMYYCFNVVTECEGFPAAVLIRALEPVEGLDRMLQNRNGSSYLTDGPGKLCQAFGIDQRLNGADLTQKPFYIAAGRPSRNVERGPRIGVDYAGAWRDKPWRFRETAVCTDTR